MVTQNYQQPGEAAAVKRMVQWILTNGQQINDDLGYTRFLQMLPKVIQTVNKQVTGP